MFCMIFLKVFQYCHFFCSLQLLLAVKNIANFLVAYFHVLGHFVMIVKCKILIILLKFALYISICLWFYIRSTLISVITIGIINITN